MGSNMTRRSFLYSSTLLAALSSAACAQSPRDSTSTSTQHEPTNEQSESASTQREPTQNAQKVLAAMTLEQKVAQMIMPSLRSLEGVTDAVTDLAQVTALAEGLRRHQYGGVALFGANIQSAEQTTRLLHDLQENNAQGAAEKSGPSIPYLVSADQEGGSVARINMGTRGTGSLALGATGDAGEEYAYGTGEMFGKELSVLGINLNLGPCADVIVNLADEGMSVRVFSDDPETAGRMALAFKSGVDQSNVITCFKHFPGANAGDDDPTAVNITLEELHEQGLHAFKHVVDEGAEVIMSVATTFPDFDDKHTLADGTTTDCYPAAMSPKIVDELLRKELGYEGVVITDALAMDQFFSAPITGAQLVPGERDSFESAVFIAQKCIEAGCDILLMPRDMNSTEVIDWYDGYMHGIADLVSAGTLSEQRIDESVLRILSLKERHSLLDGYINGDDVEASVASANEVVGAKEHHEAERLYAEKAVTLLKNEDVVPIPADAGNVVVVGRTEYARNPFLYALAELEEAGVFSGGLQVNDLITGSKTGDESAKTKVTLGAYYHLDEESCAGSWASSEGMLSAIAEARYVICESTFFSGLDALQDVDPYVQAVTRVIEAAHAAGAQVVLLSDGIPAEAARYPEADAVVCTYQYAGFDVDPTEQSDSGHMQAINANVPAALRAMFGLGGMSGKLPVTVKHLAQVEDGSWGYTNEVAFERGSGLVLKA